MWLRSLISSHGQWLAGQWPLCRMNNALPMACVWHSCIESRAAGDSHHADRGSQYTSQGYQQFLAGRGIQVSMSRRGNCSANAVMERFWATLKGECTSRSVLQTHDHARSVICDSIHCFYNWVRRHSTGEYLSPLPYEFVQS